MAGFDLAGRLVGRCALSRVTCSSRQVEQLCAYVGLLTKWNRTVNLTALSLEPIGDEAIDRQVVEALVAAAMIDGRRGHLVDLGSGGGSPAIPIKIVRNSLHLTMVESKSRKSAFLREAVRKLELSGSVVITARMEGLVDNQAMRRAAQVVSVRAVRLDESAWRVIDWLLAPDGTLLWFRSSAEPLSFPTFLIRAESRPTPDGGGEILRLVRTT